MRVFHNIKNQELPVYETDINKITSIKNSDLIIKYKIH